MGSTSSTGAVPHEDVGETGSLAGGDGADLPALFRRSAAAHCDAPAIFADAITWTYSALDTASDGVAASLAARGVVPGERVALYCPNGAEFVVAYLGILKAGAIVVPINLLLNPHEIGFMLRDAGVRGLFFHAAFAEQAAKALADAPVVQWRIGICLEHDSGAADDYLHQLIETSPAVPVQIDPANAAAVILYTSGTTGRPKGAVLTHANLASNARAVAEALDLEPATDRLLVVLPMFHAFAGTVGILTPLLAGAALVPVPRFDPQAITQAVDTHHATIFLGVPSLYAVLMRLNDDRAAQWRSVRLCISGGAALPQALMQA
ncbi:MAG: AMP-binding protein, partial [Thiohalocapsa sp.]